MGQDEEEFLYVFTLEDAKELLGTYSAEQVRQLWADGAFGASPIAVRDYLKHRILSGHLEKDGEVS